MVANNEHVFTSFKLRRPGMVGRYIEDTCARVRLLRGGGPIGPSQNAAL